MTPRDEMKQIRENHHVSFVHHITFRLCLSVVRSLDDVMGFGMGETVRRVYFTLTECESYKSTSLA